MAQIDNGADSTARGHKARPWAAVPIWQCHKVAKPGRGSLRRRIREASCRQLEQMQRTFGIGWVERVLLGWHPLEAVVVRRANIFILTTMGSPLTDDRLATTTPSYELQILISFLLCPHLGQCETRIKTSESNNVRLPNLGSGRYRFREYSDCRPFDCRALGTRVHRKRIGSTGKHPHDCQIRDGKTGVLHGPGR